MSKACCFFTVLLIAGTVFAAGENPQMIQEVMNKTRNEANASWWGFDEKNATSCLQRAINSGVERLIIDDTGSPWYIDPIQLAGNQQIIIGENVTVCARPGGFKGINDVLFTAEHKNNIVISGGEKSLITMNKTDYQDLSKYKKSEWRHALSFLSCENVTVKDLTITRSGGDGIYIGRSNNGELASCKNVRIENARFLDNHRQGISVITVENLLLRNVDASNTEGTLPQSGIDFEPNRPDECLINCVVENCKFNNNAGCGIEFFLVHLSDQSRPVSITIKNSEICNNLNNIIFRRRTTGETAVHGKVEFIDCRIANVQGGNVILNDTGNNFSALMRNCMIKNSDKNPAITVAGSNTLGDAVGNIIFDNVKIISRNAQPPIKFVIAKGTTLAENITGNLLINGQKYALSQVVEKAANASNKLQRLVPAVLSDIQLLTAQKTAASAGNFGDVSFRKSVTLLLRMQAGTKADFDIAGSQLGANNSEPDIEVIAPNAAKIKTFRIAPDGVKRNYSFNASADGIYQVKLHPHNQVLRVFPNVPAQGLMMDAESKQYEMFKPDGRLFFQVPKGVSGFSLVVSGEVGEYLDCALYDPRGKVLQEVKHFNNPTVFSGHRSNIVKSEIYSIGFSNAVEDVKLSLMKPLLPVVSQNSKNMLVLE